MMARSCECEATAAKITLHCGQISVGTLVCNVNNCLVLVSFILFLKFCEFSTNNLVVICFVLNKFVDIIWLSDIISTLPWETFTPQVQMRPLQYQVSVVFISFTVSFNKFYCAMSLKDAYVFILVVNLFLSFQKLHERNIF